MARRRTKQQLALYANLRGAGKQRRRLEGAEKIATVLRNITDHGDRMRTLVMALVLVQDVMDDGVRLAAIDEVRKRGYL